MKPTPSQEPGLRIGDLYPEMDAAQQEEAEANLDRYLACVLRIFERLRHEREVSPDGKRLTSSEKDASMDGQRSNPA